MLSKISEERQNLQSLPTCNKNNIRRGGKIPSNDIMYLSGFPYTVGVQTEAY